MNPILHFLSLLFSWVALFAIGYVWGVNDGTSITNIQSVFIEGHHAAKQNTYLREDESIERVISMNEHKIEASFMSIPIYEDKIENFPYSLYAVAIATPEVEHMFDSVVDYYNKYPFESLDASGYIEYQKNKILEFENNFNDNKILFGKGVEIANKKP